MEEMTVMIIARVGGAEPTLCTTAVTDARSLRKTCREWLVGHADRLVKVEFAGRKTRTPPGEPCSMVVDYLINWATELGWGEGNPPGTLRLRAGEGDIISRTVYPETEREVGLAVRALKGAGFTYVTMSCNAGEFTEPLGHEPHVTARAITWARAHGWKPALSTDTQRQQEAGESPPAFDIVMVHGPQGCGKTTNMYRIAEHYGMTTIRDDCQGEWPCPITLQGKQYVLYLTSDLDYEWIGRAVAVGFRVLVIAFDKLPEGVVKAD